TASDEPTVVVAHSYGGIVTAEAAAGLDTVRHLLRPAGGPGRDVPAGLRSGDSATGHGQDGPAEPGGHRTAGAVSGLAARALDVPRLREGPGHPRRPATRVRRSGSQRRGNRRRPPPVPLPARHRPRPNRRAVTSTTGVH